MIKPGQLRRWRDEDVILERNHSQPFLVLYADPDFVNETFWRVLTVEGMKLWSEKRMAKWSEVISEEG